MIGIYLCSCYGLKSDSKLIQSPLLSIWIENKSEQAEKVLG